MLIPSVANLHLGQVRDRRIETVETTGNEKTPRRKARTREVLAAAHSSNDQAYKVSTVRQSENRNSHGM